MKTPPPFAKETDLCAEFLKLVSAFGGWVAYPETEGWDILLVHKAEGIQIGIEAKLKLNAKVLLQAIEGKWSSDGPGPDFRAILVPDVVHNEIGQLADRLGVTVIRVRGGAGRHAHFYPELPTHHLDQQYDEWWPRLPLVRHTLPEFVPDVVAGSSGPLMLTRWKIQAIKLAVLLEQTGFLIRQDFKDKRVDCRRWIDRWSGWLRVEGGRFVRGDKLPDFKAQHPKIWEEVAGKPDLWQRPIAEPKKAAQGALL